MPFIIIGAILLLMLLFAVFALSLRGTLTIAYDGEFKVFFKVLFIKIKIFPFKEKRQKHRVRHMSRRRAARIRKQVEKREALKKKYSIKNIIRDALTKKDADKPEKKKKAEIQTAAKKKASPNIKITADDVSTVLDILRLTVELVALTVKQFAKRLRVKVARLKVKVATPDAAVTAVAYGAVTQTVNILLPILREVKNFDLPKQKNFDVTADFTTDKPDIDMELSFSLRVWHLIDIPLPAIEKAIPRLPKYIDKVLEKIKEIKGEEKEDADNENKSADNKAS